MMAQKMMGQKTMAQKTVAGNLVANRKVSDAEAWAHLAVCDEELFVRELYGISVYRWRAPSR